MLILEKNLKVGSYELIVRAAGNTFERIETLSFYVKQKPKVNYVEINPVFDKVLEQAGIVLPEEGLTEQQIFQCPDLSSIVAGGEGELEPVVESVEEASNWALTSGVVLLVNIVLAVAGFFGFKLFKKKMTVKDEQLSKTLGV